VTTERLLLAGSLVRDAFVIGGVAGGAYQWNDHKKLSVARVDLRMVYSS
jgi:uncharacterized membrane protein